MLFSREGVASPESGIGNGDAVPATDDPPPAPQPMIRLSPNAVASHAGHCGRRRPIRLALPACVDSVLRLDQKESRSESGDGARSGFVSVRAMRIAAHINSCEPVVRHVRPTRSPPFASARTMSRSFSTTETHPNIADFYPSTTGEIISLAHDPAAQASL